MRIVENLNSKRGNELIENTSYHQSIKTFDLKENRRRIGVVI
ncbi:hypothetical protein [Flavobacterium fluviale]|nr:hypothetical protein [Flavobacterium fluviale]